MAKSKSDLDDLYSATGRKVGAPKKAENKPEPVGVSAPEEGAERL